MKTNRYRIPGSALLAVCIFILFSLYGCAHTPGGDGAGTTYRQETAASGEPSAPASDLPTDEPPSWGTDVSEAPSTEPATSDGDLPTGKLVVTKERREYKDKSLTLRIPALNVTYEVNDGTDAEALRVGVGLYEYAQLPGEGNRNVSIAGHRNGLSGGKVTDKAPFYYVDKLKEGDYLYLSDSNNIYRYTWEWATVIERDNWDPIRTTGYSCITLTSCHPIGTDNQRIIIRGKLDAVLPFDKDYAYPASE